MEPCIICFHARLLSSRLIHGVVHIKMSFLLRADNMPLLMGQAVLYPSSEGGQVQARPSGSCE